LNHGVAAGVGHALSVRCFLQLLCA
jgi:hypothetical protein